MAIGRSKITIVGAGFVGATAAHWAAAKELGDIVLVDIIEGLPQGKGLDLLQAGPVEDFDAGVTGTNSYDETEGSDVVIITAGIARKPGMSRDDLIATNLKIVGDVTRNVVERSPESFIIMVSNPLDAMTYAAYKVSGFPAHRVMGMAGVLDSARMATFIAQELRVSVENVHAFVLGGHGDTMVPLPRFTTVAGIPITELMPRDRVDAICQRTAGGGAEIVSLLKTGSAFYAPGAAVVKMAESILKDKKMILPSCVYLSGAYGVDGYFVGVPAKLGAGGVEEVIEIGLSEDEQAAFDRSVDAVKELTAIVDENL